MARTKQTSRRKLGADVRNAIILVATKAEPERMIPVKKRQPLNNPKGTKSKAAKPNAAKPKATKPKATKPKTTKSKVTKSKAAKPKAAKPKAPMRLQLSSVQQPELDDPPEGVVARHMLDDMSNLTQELFEETVEMMAADLLDFGGDPMRLAV